MSSQKTSRLEKEIQSLTELRVQLEAAQKRLITSYQINADPILSVNQEKVICFFNQKAEEIFGLTQEEAIGKTLELVFSASSAHRLYQIFFRKRGEFLTDDIKKMKFNVIGKRTGVEYFSSEVFVSAMQHKKEQTGLIILKNLKLIPSSHPPLAEWESPFNLSNTSHGVDLTLNRLFADCRKNVENIDKVISQLLEVLIEERIQWNQSLEKVMQTAQDQNHVPLSDSKDVLRQSLVDTMRFAVACWEKGTGKTKIELAEESGLWRTYMDKGSYQTRTLDKYLSMRNIPKRPRFDVVLNTALYVLNHTLLPPSDKKKLRSLLWEVQALVS